MNYYQVRTKGQHARDKNGDGVSFGSEHAISYCMMGALFKCFGNEAYLMKHKLFTKLPGVRSIVEFNDNPYTSYEDVINLLKSANL